MTHLKQAIKPLSGQNRENAKKRFQTYFSFLEILHLEVGSCVQPNCNSEPEINGAKKQWGNSPYQSFDWRSTCLLWWGASGSQLSCLCYPGEFCSVFVFLSKYNQWPRRQKDVLCVFVLIFWRHSWEFLRLLHFCKIFKTKFTLASKPYFIYPGHWRRSV